MDENDFEPTFLEVQGNSEEGHVLDEVDNDDVVGEPDEPGEEESEQEDEDGSDEDDDNEPSQVLPSLKKLTTDTTAAGTTGKRKLATGGVKKRKKKERELRFFDDEAADAEDSEDDEGDYLDRENRVPEDLVLDKDVIAAAQKVDSRHQANRDFLNASAEEIAEQYRVKHKREQEFKSNYGSTDEMRHTNIAVAQQALLPSIKDPKIFKIKCKPGFEMQLVRSILLKTMDLKQGGFLKIKSAFCTSTKGFIYVESLNETFAKEIVQGLRQMYVNSFAQIPVAEMTTVLSVTVKKKPLTRGQWVRLRRGPLKGDLAVVVDLFDGGQRAFIKAVPRPDYTAVNADVEGKKKAGALQKVRPPQRLFDAQEAMAIKSNYLKRAHHPLDSVGTPFDVWDNQYFRDGFVFREVNVTTFLDEVNVKPTIEELQMFRPRKNKNNNDDENDEDDAENDENGSVLGGGGANVSFVKELAQQIDSIVGEEEEKDSMNPFVPGDLVMVTKGEMRNLVARVVAVNDATRVAKIMPYENSITTVMEFEMDLLRKHIFPGSHVKVVGGKYQGQTGRVVNVNESDGVSVAAVLTDGINSEIQCNVSHLQLSSEVTSGQGDLMGYELYDLVAVNESEMAVVVGVGAEKLKIITNSDAIKEVYPQELQGKKNFMSGPRASGFDSQHSTIKVGDTVNVTSGPHVKLSGTIKHMNKGMLWLHSNTHLKNSGVFVVRSRNCAVAGGKSATPMLSNSYGGVLQSTPVIPGHSSAHEMGKSPSSLGSHQQGGGGRGQGAFTRDSNVGKTVKIKKGKFKGLLAQVIDSTDSHYNVELLARFKRVTVEKSMVDTVGDKQGMLQQDGGARGMGGMLGTGGPTTSLFANPGQHPEAVPSTPFLTAQTPRHTMGMETPRYSAGGETPLPNYGDRTPSRNYGDDAENVWTVHESDTVDMKDTNSSSSYGGGSGYYGETSQYAAYNSSSNSGGWGSVSTPVVDPYNNSSPLSVNTFSTTSHHAQNNSGNNSAYSLSDNHTDVGTPVVVPVAATAATWQDWQVNQVVLCTSLNAMGRLAVILQTPDEDGMLVVDMRDGKGHLENKPFTLSVTNVKLPPLAKKYPVAILAGKCKGQTGLVKAVAGKDVMVDISGRTETLKMANVGWLNAESS